MKDKFRQDRDKKKKSKYNRNIWSREVFSGAPPAGAGGSFPKRDIPRLAESIQPQRELGAFCSGVTANSPKARYWSSRMKI